MDSGYGLINQLNKDHLKIITATDCVAFLLLENVSNCCNILCSVGKLSMDPCNITMVYRNTFAS